jgi:hypothetical protein
MKTILLTIALSAACTLCQAQVPDSSRYIKTPSRVDSVKHGNEVYNGSKTQKNKSNGDTLASPRTKKGTGTTPKTTTPATGPK